METKKLISIMEEQIDELQQAQKSANDPKDKCAIANEISKLSQRYFTETDQIQYLNKLIKKYEDKLREMGVDIYRL